MSGGKGTLSPGTNLSCTTTLGATLKGTVLATDDNFGAIVIREGNSSGSVHLINLRYLADLKILPSSSSEVRPPPTRQPVSLMKVRKRLENTVEARKTQMSSLGVNVTPQAQQLFNHIRKLYDDTRWDGSVIVVLGDTRISPPYTPDSLTGSPKGTTMISKLLTKYLED